ncbi:Membrane-bound transcription factor site-2 protease [Lamellibrachia satsuma]|nr:Membrane-bound transcription factor site-2 protease [Lamellibrachia satsuma]
MFHPTSIAWFLGTWASIYLVDAFLKTNSAVSRHYLQFLHYSGLSVSIGQIRWYTTCFNRLLLRLGQWRPRWVQAWFTWGVYFGIVAMFGAVGVLGMTLINAAKQKPADKQVLTPVMPGVNLPMNQISYYLLTLLVCGILHELGHAIAAVREQVRVCGFGLFVFPSPRTYVNLYTEYLCFQSSAVCGFGLFVFPSTPEEQVRVCGFGLFVFAIYPGAYVNLYTEHLQVISPMRQLRVYCAGVWHNFVVVLAAIAVLMSLPWLLSPFYHTGSAVVITSVVEGSSVSGPRGLYVGDEVRSMSGCRVSGITDWLMCINGAMAARTSSGYCMPLPLLDKYNIALDVYTDAAGTTQCCRNSSATHLCFLYHTKSGGRISHITRLQKYACLPARTTTDRPLCRLQSDCYNPTVPHVCVVPSVDNSTKLLRVERRRSSALLFLGYPLDLHYAVTLSDYVPNYSFVPVNLPYSIETFCNCYSSKFLDAVLRYVISLSGALALLNVVPCYALDGQFILHALIELSLTAAVPDSQHRGAIYMLIMLFGTLLLAANIVVAMWSLFVH